MVARAPRIGGPALCRAAVGGQVHLIAVRLLAAPPFPCLQRAHMPLHENPTDSDLPARHAGWAVRLAPGGVVLGVRVPPTRPGRPLGTLQGRAARRLSELAALASWRAQCGVLSDPTGWAAVAADCLAELQGVGAWRCDAAGIAAQLPPGTEDAAAAVAAALAAPHRPGRLLSGRDAGRLVDLVALEADDASMGKPISTMVARDLDDDALAARRRQRRREGARERKRRARAKCVTCVNVTFQTPSNVTLARHTSRITMERDVERVTIGTPGQAITAETVAAALALKPGAARARLLRWSRAGLVIGICRGRYRLAECVP
jgi:hypothetical protein